MAGVRFRGLSPRTAYVRWGLTAVAIGIAIGGTASEALRLLAATVGAGPGSLPWLTSRIVAFLAYLALTGSVVYGLLLSTKLLDAIAHRPITFTLHQDLASFGLGLAAIHGTLLALDRTVPASLAQLAVPFATSYRPLWVGVGQLSFFVMAAVIASFYLRRRIGQRTWRLLHSVTFLSFAGATVHGWLSGTDSGSWGRWVYLVATAVVVFLFVYRLVLATGRRSPARDLAAAPIVKPIPVRSLRAG
jgi:sulfoxide reductase heme-binding subunit YedZ